MAAKDSGMYSQYKDQVSRSSIRGKGPMSLEQILYDPVNLKVFKTFCVQERSVENLLFWLETADYRTAEAPEYRRHVAKKIFRKYCAEGTKMEIAVKAATRKKVSPALLTDLPSLTLFDELRSEVMLSMKMDIFPRFVESDGYDALVELKFEQRKVVDMDEFDLYHFLGAGGFGMVLLAQKKDTGCFYAMKVMDKRILLSQNQTHSIFREKEVLACVEHPFVVALRYGFQTEDHLCLVLDFIEGGNMYTDLMRGPYTHERAMFYAAEIVLAMQHLHELDILYRDLKPDNVLLTLNGNCRLADMGAARGVSDDGTIRGGEQATASAPCTAKPVDLSKGRRMSITGTHGYRAPEVYERNYGKPADWWTVGILIIEMLTGDNPLRGSNRKESEHLAKHMDLTNALPSSMQASSRSCSLALLNRDATQRLGCGANGPAEIKEHPFFKPIDWEQLMAQEMAVPFEPDLDYEPTKHENIPTGTSQIDYFCTKVDYMQTSMSMRSTWPLNASDQAVFRSFDFVSNKVFEEELTEAYRREHPAESKDTKADEMCRLLQIL